MRDRDHDIDRPFDEARFSQDLRALGNRAVQDYRRAARALAHDSAATNRGDDSVALTHALDERIEHTIFDSKSLAGPLLRHGITFRDSLQAMSAPEHGEYREQLVVEVLHNHYFCTTGYERISAHRDDGSRSTRWTQLFESEKLELVKEAEALVAYVEGRRPCTIGISCGLWAGSYVPEHHHINIDERLLNHADSEQRVLRTLFHEQAHARQWTAVHHSEMYPEVTSIQREEWRHNFANRKQPGLTRSSGVAYRDQPLERDARALAGQQWRRFDDARRRSSELDE